MSLICYLLLHHSIILIRTAYRAILPSFLSSSYTEENVQILGVTSNANCRKSTLNLRFVAQSSIHPRRQKKQQLEHHKIYMSVCLFFRAILRSCVKKHFLADA
ncbi:hypothetical protein QYE76_021058 [Lolium multiflorum]|uniref:Secreted protein n=1 Tax=Lolium multiflorum TaxID=4521 RepID=A0AAD8R760_LOLMU|nr:hypothetical protein QYE76_021058 [Lolium multiflorum]